MVVGGCNDNATISTSHAYSKFSGRSAGIADINDIITHAHECAYNNVAHHQSRHTTVAAYHHLSAMNILSEGRGKFDDVKGIQRIARAPTYGAIDS